MKIAVWFPYYKFLDANVVESLIGMMSDIHGRGDVYYPVVAHSIGIDAARNMCAAVTLKDLSDMDYVLSLDTDHIYSAKALYALIEKMEANGWEQLSAAYRSRNSPAIYAHFQVVDGKHVKIDYPQTGIIECHSVGFGFNVLRLSFLKRMAEKHQILFKNHDVLHLGEDVYFCELQRKEGVPVRFDADTKVGHITSVVL
jgi:hypothetical protein